MRTRSSVKRNEAACDPSEHTDEDRKLLLEESIQNRGKMAESSLEMAAMFVKNGKVGIARRRLREIVAEFEGSVAAGEAKAMLKKLGR